jgi:hypothetical protein
MGQKHTYSSKGQKNTSSCDDSLGAREIVCKSFVLLFFIHLVIDYHSVLFSFLFLNNLQIERDFLGTTHSQKQANAL